MATVSSTGWLAWIALAIGMAGVLPATARAEDRVRIVVAPGDVVYRGGHAYYRHGDGGYGSRLVISNDRHGRALYYLDVPRGWRGGPPYGEAHGYWKNVRTIDSRHRARCDAYGRCVTRYYDPRTTRRYYPSQGARYYDAWYNTSGSRYYDAWYNGGRQHHGGYDGTRDLYYDADYDD